MTDTEVPGQAPDGEFRWTGFTNTKLVDDDGLVRSEGVDDSGTR